MARRKESASQTAGPYVHIGCLPNLAGLSGVYPADLGAAPFPADAPGERITLTGRILDGTGHALRDAMIETWQADGAGRYGPGAQGFARFACDGDSGLWSLDTIRPGAVGRMAPHVTVWIVARGINIGLHTRIYFPEDEDAHANDPWLARIEHRHRIPTLIATADGPGRYRFDIRLQGENETIFFDV